FSTTVDRVSTVATDKTSAVSLKISENQVNISVNAPDCGFAKDEIAATYSGEELEIGFNSRYLIEVAAQVSGKQCEFNLSDSASPALIKDLEDEKAVYVLMPMRT
ncbi:MAG: DNA polymerase III subunit beta, partial [Alphaproteobacteria bacterium]|nr:DNA polymerase III subunit beta [Alphaproteobacteria bacterium]